VGLQHLAGLKSLRDLRLSGAHLTDAVLGFLIQNDLLEIVANYRTGSVNEIGQEGRPPPPKKGNSEVDSLDLSGTKVTHAGLKHRAGLKNLKSLHIASGWVTDELLEFLHQNRQIHILGLAEGNGNSRPGSDDEILSIRVGSRYLTRPIIKENYYPP